MTPDFNPRALFVFVALLLCLPGANADSIEHSAASFFRHSDFRELRMSPDGTRLAVATRLDDEPDALNLVVMDLDTRATNTVTAFRSQDVNWYYWANNDRILFSTVSGANNPNQRPTYSGINSVRPDGSEGRGLRAGRGLHGIIDALPALPRVVLARSVNKGYSAYDIVRLDITNSKSEKVVKNDGRMLGFMADNSGHVRFAISIRDDPKDLRRDLLHRKNDRAPWENVFSYESGDLIPLGFAADNRHAYVNVRLKSDRLRLHTLDTTTGEFSEPLVEDPTYDTRPTDQGLMQDKEGNAISFTYAGAKPVTVYFNPIWEARQRAIDSVMPEGNINTIVQFDDNQSRFLVYTWSDRDAGSYYLYDEEKQAIRQILTVSPELKPTQMASMTPVTFAARDGLALHGYLTRPAHIPDDGAAPLIIYPHGGPYGIRDYWGFDRPVQYLASRGYAVLQVNFRGSGGYGKAFEQDAYRKWGLEMQDDITDARAWAIDQGVADPKRIAIYGASYGGYATLMGLIKTPNLYQAGVAFVAPVDLKSLVKDGLAYGARTDSQKSQRARLLRILGDYKADEKRLQETSPINAVNRIQAPLLVAHGGNDGVVPMKHYRRLVKALKKNDKSFDTIYRRFEGHGYAAAVSNIELYERIDQFLQEAFSSESL